jgi:hypothetical protein
MTSGYEDFCSLDSPHIDSYINHLRFDWRSAECNAAIRNNDATRCFLQRAPLYQLRSAKRLAFLSD